IPKIEIYQGKLTDSADNLLQTFKLQDELSNKLGRLYTYSRMRYDQDTRNSFYQDMNARVENVLTLLSSSMSFIVPEILTMDEDKIESFLNEKEELKLYRKVLDEIIRQRPHVLSEKEEVLLAKAADPMDNAAQTFGMLNNADLTFSSIKNEEG